MDDYTFHQELARLKHRVSQMASTYQRFPFTPQPLGRSDAFHHQLHDLKTQLESMQSSLSSLTGMPTPAAAPWSWQPFETSATPSPAATAQPHSHLNLPSGPLFWQLFTSLRTDVRSLDSRVAGLEQKLSNLEDRVDNLEPTQFTPAASEDTTIQTSTNAYAQPTAQQLDECFVFGSPQAPKYGPWSPMANEWATQYSEPSFATFGVDDRSMYQSSPAFNFDSASAASEGVAFRDREIAHLDELMRKAQESIQHSDAVILEKDAQIRQLTSERDRADEKNYDLQQSLQAVSMNFNEKKDYIESLEDESHSKNAALRAWVSKHNAMQQSFLEKKTQLCHADRQIQQLQRALYDLQNSRNDEIDELTSSKDDEIRKLRQFCEAKEAVGYQQEQIVARGAKLLEERDAELARLGQQLKGLDDDYRNETRERARFARLLDERDDEIGQLKASLSRVIFPKAIRKHTPDKSPAGGHKEDAKATYPHSPFVAVANGRRETSNGQWTPKAIENRGHGLLPHEERRASVWRTGLPTPEQHKFGVPGAFASPPQGSDVSNNQDRDLRRSNSLKLLERLALVEEGGNRPARSSTGSGNVTKRSRLPLDDDDDVASRPPLPARVPPRKMGSVIELGSQSQRDGETDQQRPISRHQSIQELPKPRLQAYVEDGASGGDA